MRTRKTIRNLHVHFTSRIRSLGKFEFKKKIDCTLERAATPNGDSKKGAHFWGGAGKTESLSPRGVGENLMQYAAI